MTTNSSAAPHDSSDSNREDSRDLDWEVILGDPLYSSFLRPQLGVILYAWTTAVFEGIAGVGLTLAYQRHDISHLIIISLIALAGLAALSWQIYEALQFGRRRAATYARCVYYLGIADGVHELRKHRGSY